MKTYSDNYKNFIKKYLDRPWKPEDGLTECAILKSEQGLRFKLPQSLKDLYLTIGKIEEFMSVQNQIFLPDQLKIKEGYLLFMDENQSVVSWGILMTEIDNPNPIVWQRNNTENIWYSEEKSFIDLLESMFHWYSDIEVFDN